MITDEIARAKENAAFKELLELAEEATEMNGRLIKSLEKSRQETRMWFTNWCTAMILLGCTIIALWWLALRPHP